MTSESPESSSDSDSESKAEILIPRSHQQSPVWVIQGRREDDTEQGRGQLTEQPQPQPRPQPRPCPCPHICQQPPETGDVGEAEISSIADAVGNQGGLEAMGEADAPEQVVHPEADTNEVPRNMEDGLEAGDGSAGVQLTTQSGEIEAQVDPPRRRNPRRGKQVDTTKT